MTEKMIQKNFKRTELKYVIDHDTYQKLSEAFKDHLVADEFAQSTITNIYFDTSDFQMIQNAIAKKGGREKVRMRTYQANPDLSSQAFLEIKKKINDIGYNFRTTAKASEILEAVETTKTVEHFGDPKLADELNRLHQIYKQLQPMMYIYYDRRSFKGKENPNLRITLDQNLIYRPTNVNYQAGKTGYPLLEPDHYIMEIKLVGEAPSWLTAILDEFGIEEDSFSKYAQSYLASQQIKTGGGGHV